MAVVQRLLEWKFIEYEEESNDGDGTETYDLATGGLKAVDGCTERIVAVLSGGF